MEKHLTKMLNPELLNNVKRLFFDSNSVCDWLLARIVTTSMDFNDRNHIQVTWTFTQDESIHLTETSMCVPSYFETLISRIHKLKSTTELVVVVFFLSHPFESSYFWSSYFDTFGSITLNHRLRLFLPSLYIYEYSNSTHL